MVILLGYVEVKLHVHEQDLKEGLTIKFLQIAGEDGLIPHTWMDEEHRNYKCIVETERDENNIVNVTHFGGTQEQFEIARKHQEALCAALGWTLEDFEHFPLEGRPLTPRAN